MSAPSNCLTEQKGGSAIFCLDNIVQPVQRLLALFIDAKVNESIQLRAQIAPLWKNAFSPTLVNKEFSAWLKLTPDKIVMSPILTAGQATVFNDRLSVHVTAQGESRVILK